MCVQILPSGLGFDIDNNAFLIFFNPLELLSMELELISITLKPQQPKIQTHHAKGIGNDLNFD